MDPISHGLIGLGIASLSGEPLSLQNPIYVSALIGSLAPDFDIVLQAGGDLVYLRHHRGISHSIPGTAIIAGLLAAPLTVVFPASSWGTLFIWTWLGALFHAFIDIFNSYGAELLWPLYRKKISVNLLNIFDPYLFLLIGLMLFAEGFMPGVQGWVIGLVVLYLMSRFVLRQRVKKLLFRRYGSQAKRIVVLPALKGNWTWDVFIETKDNFIVGQIYSFSLMFSLRRMLWKQQSSLIKTALESKLGKLFKEFTPLFHVSLQSTENGYLVRFYDLRYHLKQQFLHTGTAIFNADKNLVEEVFSPYLGKRNIKLAG